MDKTRVDSMLIEMIEPKIQEINKKFSIGGTLTQEDINTLLLKSQYNHINHLDSKLNETVEAVRNLEIKFDSLKAYVDRRFETFEQRFETFEQRFETFEQRFETFEQKVEATIQEALNKNMMKLIAIMGAFIALFKIIDKF